MFCPNCGTVLSNDYQTVPNSNQMGAENIPGNKNGKKSCSKKVLIGILCSTIIVSAIFLCFIYFTDIFHNLSNVKYEGSGYSSAKEVSKTYVDALSEGDYQKMISCFAVESYVEHYDMKEYIKRIQCYTPTMKLNYLNSDDFSNAMLVTTRLSEIQSALNNQYLILSGVTQNMIDAGYEPGCTIALQTAEDINTFMKDIYGDTNSISSIKIGNIKIVNPSEVGLSEEYLDRAKEHMEKLMAIYGCDDIEDVIMSFTLNGQQYYLFTECVKYDGSWYLQGFSGIYGSIRGISSVNAGLLPEEYEE